MSKKSIEKALARASEMCTAAGGKLTDKRRHVLAILLSDGAPRSAYEIADAYSHQWGQSMPANSVYRILDFLASENLVHKLASSNKYIACSHITCEHSHQVPQFLICRECHRVKEVGINKKIVEALQASCKSAGFSLVSPQLELQCVCDLCSGNAATAGMDDC